MIWHWIINLSKAFIRLPIFIWAWLKAEPVTIDVALHRIALCHDCEKLDLITRQCTKCWCFVSRKVRWKDEKCPLGKWKEII
jgi:hypothetical protein